jgi:glycogen operon protein
MVRALHAAGLEVILDVVYNHTAEGGPNGPTMCFRGLDNPAYYRLDPDDPARYRDVTGCGNTLDARSPVARRLVLDSLRYWVEEMHVDGFRFDLASALGRVDGDFEPAAPLIQEIATDPVLAGVKLIAEAWDAAPGGYAVGRFPPPWADWNGIFRDTVRDFWRGRGPTSDLARALAGSSDAYAPSGRGPLASVNYVACHDGMPLRDLVSYDHKWNLANGEGNRDGDDHNRSWNSGVEGPTDDVAVRELRRRRAAAMLATVFCSAGVPMIGQGDERWRTQQGNNNAYCHDSPLTWLSWADDPETMAMRDLVARLVRLRAEHPVLRREGWFRGDRGDGSPVDVRWLTPDGRGMDDTWWQPGEARVLGALYAGAATPEGGSDVLVVANAAGASVWFDLPAGAWARLLDSSRPGGVPEEGTATEAVDVPAWAVLVLRRA